MATREEMIDELIRRGALPAYTKEGRREKEF